MVRFIMKFIATVGTIVFLTSFVSMYSAEAEARAVVRAFSRPSIHRVAPRPRPAPTPVRQTTTVERDTGPSVNGILTDVATSAVGVVVGNAIYDSMQEDETNDDSKGKQ